MRHLALLRGINVGGKHKLPMAELRELALSEGLSDPRTYIQSGNLIFEADEPGDQLAELLEAAIRARFGLDIPVIVRDAPRWIELAAASPFPDAEDERANLLHFAASKLPPAPDAAERLAPYASAGERIAVVGDGLWIDFPSGVARSKLSPAVLDRCVGSPVTARNWRSVQKLAELLTV